MRPIITVSNLTKTYAGGFTALRNIDLKINDGEIFGLLGPNGAGKTTLISIICGIVTPSTGAVTVNGHDIIRDYRKTRSLIGLVPQELTTDAFESVWNTVSFSRGLFGKLADPDHIERVLRDLTLWEKKDARIMELSGGMKRRVLIAKALSHEPRILFLDEPTAGLDPIGANRFDELIKELSQALGLTVVMVTHDLDSLHAVCHRVSVLIDKRVMVGTIDELMRVPDAWIQDYFTGPRGRAALASGGPPREVRSAMPVDKGDLKTESSVRGGEQESA